MSLENLIGSLEDTAIEGVAGITWFDKKIYVIFLKHNTLFVFSDESPFKEFQKLRVKIPNMVCPSDMVVCNTGKSSFIIISDTHTRCQCLWKIILQNEASERVLPEHVATDGQPYTLSVMSSGHLLVVTKNINRDGATIDWCLDKYWQNLTRIERIKPDFMSNVGRIIHAVEISDKTIIVLWQEQDVNSYRIDEITHNDFNTWKLISSYVIPTNIRNYSPEHLSVIRNDLNNIRLLVADDGGRRVFQINISKGSMLQILPKEMNLESPLRLCFLPESFKLIVAQSRAKRYVRDKRSLVIFNLFNELT